MECVQAERSTKNPEHVPELHDALYPLSLTKIPCGALVGFP